MSAKQILIVTSELVPFRYGGIGTQFKSLVSLLKRHGHRVSLLSRRPENFDETLFRTCYGEVPLFFVEIPPVQAGRPQHFVYAAEVARRFDGIYPEIRPDLVILADFDAEGLFLLLQSGAGAYGETEFLLTINGMNYEAISVHEGEGRETSSAISDLPDIRSLLAMEDLCVHLARRIVSPTVCVWEQIRRRLGIDKAARIIPNLINLDLFDPDGKGMRGELQERPFDKETPAGYRIPLKTERKEEPREPLILFVGRLDRMKGPDLLLKAYLEIADQPDTEIPRIIFIGRDCFWKAYNSTFLEYWKDRIPEKYRGFVSFLGQVSHDQIRDYLQKATVSVFPSRWEPFGIVCLEAMAMGCPVVVSEGTGLEEVLGPTLSEFAVPVTEDIRPLARKILSLLRADPHDFSEKMRERAREVVHQAEEGWLDLLRDLDRKEGRLESSVAGSVCSPVQRLLVSLDDQWRGISYLQIYFSRRGHYSEMDSIRRSYAGSRWTTLKIPLPSGTGDRYLRLDPVDKPGSVRMKQILLLDDAGKEIWRADGANRFQGCSVGGKDDEWSIKNECLVIEARTDDPQMLIDCPVTDQPVTMSVTLYAGDELKADISPRQDKVFFVMNEETILDDRINFHQMLNVAINSCIRNTSLKPFIIYDGRHNDRIDSYKNRAVVLDYPLSFAEDIRRVLKKSNTSIAAMLKIEIPKILETYQMKEEYVFFADADVLFTEKFTCPGIRPEYYAASSEFELDQDIPNNTGFIVINVKGMRNTYEDFKRFVIENLEWLNQGVSWDQHYLNEYYLKRGLVTFLGREYNWKAYWPMNREAKVIHFHGPKPTYKDKFINNIPNDYDDTRFVFSRYEGVNGFDSYLYWCEEWEKYLK